MRCFLALSLATLAQGQVDVDHPVMRTRSDNWGASFVVPWYQAQPTPTPSTVPRITVTPTVDQAPTWLNLPVAPGARPGVTVVVSGLTAGVDAVEITVRYRATDGRIFSRTQTPETMGLNFVVSTFLIGSLRDGVAVMSVSVREIRYQSVEERSYETPGQN